MKKLKVAIIGCGNVSKVHFAATTTNPSAQLIAVCDIKEDRAQSASAKYGVPYYTDYEEALALGPDIIHVCTPTIITPKLRLPRQAWHSHSNREAHGGNSP